MELSLKALLLSCLVLTTSSCSQLNKAQSGAGIGAASGAVIGQAIGLSTSATLIGAAVGTMAGDIVGNEMDKYDNSQLNRVYEQGLSGPTIAANVSRYWPRHDGGAGI